MQRRQIIRKRGFVRLKALLFLSYPDMLRQNLNGLPIVPTHCVHPVVDSGSELVPLRVHHPDAGDVRGEGFQLRKVHRVRVQGRDDVALGWRIELARN